MKPSSIRSLLLVENNPGDARLLREMFNDQGPHATTLHHVETVALAERHLADQVVEMVVLDLGLPDAQGLEGVRRVRLAAPAAPLVVLTGRDDETLAVQALQEGAQDYLIKGQIETRGLLRALRYAVERKLLEDRTRALAHKVAHSAAHDFLTGLPNRLRLNDRIELAIALAKRHSKKSAILFLDLDGFKHVNDSLGHPAGDKLLQSVATRLVACVRGCDTVSRQGGDEFVALLGEIEGPEDAAVIARRMLQAIQDPHSIDGRDLHITGSAGVSLYPDDGLDAETLIRTADTAMYQAKEMGRQTFRFFKAAMNDRAVERQSIESQLRRALERDEFVIHYQPKIRLKTGTIIGAEALLRWRHPTRGMVPPGQFVPIAEDCGLIRPIGDWVLHQACTQAQAWLDAGVALGTMAVNVSAMQFTDEAFLDRLETILRETRLSPCALELELTESVLLKRVEETGGALQRMRDLGVRIAIDDFGTGYSSLGYLLRFPVDVLKIDQSFVQQIGEATHHGTLVAAIIDMARALKLRVIAEGVETLEQLEFLRNLGCDEVQGFYFSEPVTPKAFARLLSSKGDARRWRSAA